MKQQNGLAIRVKGKVQGVGFRPFVWQLAHQLNLIGRVYNDSAGVQIELWDSRNIELFLQKLVTEHPNLSRIDEITQTPYYWTHKPIDFIITNSQSGTVDTLIVPDAATCDACLDELKEPSDRRFNYPFTNCTHCGPRFTIINKIPYDRPHTSMSSFKLCSLCQHEYQNPNDRRFHAQPTACPICGPHIWLTDKKGVTLAIEQSALTLMVEKITQGQIIAMKNLGGFHLVCDAQQEEVIQRLRKNKQRPHKPFAIMIPDVSWLTPYIANTADIDKIEKALRHVSAPIVLIPINKDIEIANAVFPDLLEIGVMLPSNPLQHLLAMYYTKPLIMTSANGNGLPPALNNDEALNDLSGIADYWLMHNRNIIQRADDSVVRVHHTGIELIRRARGYVPDTLPLPPDLTQLPDLLALGADLKNTFSLIQQQQVFVSQHLGNIQSPITIQHWQETISQWLALYEPKLNCIVADAHPNYFTHQYGKQLSQQLNIPFIPVSHHHAHLVACLAEHQYPINASKVIGLVLDGIGYGKQGKLWGGECLLFNYTEYERLGGLPAVALPGGDLAAKHPWRNLLAHCLTFAPEYITTLKNTIFDIDSNQIELLSRSISQNINSPLASSAGRLFDAVSAALDIAPKELSWEGEAACKLETLAAQYQGSLIKEIIMPVDKNGILDLVYFWQAWFKSDASPEAKAYAFHYALAQGMATLAKTSAIKYHSSIIVLSGGVLQNKLLRRLLIEQLSEYTLYLPYQLPVNDGGISYGQAFIASTKLLHQQKQ